MNNIIKVSHNTPHSHINSVLCVLIPSTMLCLLYFSSRVSLTLTLVLGVLFSFLMLTNYALMHEAAHGSLHRNSFWNHALGTFTGWHFPMSCRFLTITHLVHHRCNRTDHEMFDYYYEGDNKFIKYCQWYGILLGFHYLIVPLGGLLVALMPKQWIIAIAKRYRSSGALFDDFTVNDINRIRFEVAGCFVYWFLIWNLLGLDWVSVLILYALAGFQWSTRQYVTHAFTPRDVKHGALILKANPIMKRILLNGNYDLAHHLYPRASWIKLEHLAPKDIEPMSFWQQYFSMWKGPRLCNEPAPSPL